MRTLFSTPRARPVDYAELAPVVIECANNPRVRIGETVAAIFPDTVPQKSMALKSPEIDAVLVILGPDNQALAEWERPNRESKWVRLIARENTLTYVHRFRRLPIYLISREPWKLGEAWDEATFQQPDPI